MTNRMTPSRHERAADSRHWRLRLSAEEEREALIEYRSTPAPEQTQENER